MEKSRISYVATHPLTIVVSLVLGGYLAFFLSDGKNIPWLDTLFELRFFRLMMFFILLLFQLLVLMLFLSNFIISINTILSDKKLLSRLGFHIAISIIAKLLLSVLMLVGLIFFVHKTHRENLLVQEIQSQTTISETNMSLEHISTDIASGTFIDSLMNDQQNMRVIYKHNNRLYGKYVFLVVFILIFLLSLLMVGIHVYLKKVQNKNSDKSTKAILDQVMTFVQFIAISSFKIVELVLLLLPIWIIILLQYASRLLVNKNLLLSLMHYIYAFYIFVALFIIINAIVLLIKTKKGLRKITKALVYPTLVSFCSGSSIVALHTSVYNSVKYLNTKPKEAKSFLPLYFFFFRMGNVIYFVFISFICFYIFSPILFSIDFVLLAFFATLFSFIPTGDIGIVDIYILGIFLSFFTPAFGPVLIIILGIDILFKPFRNALSTNFAITIVCFLSQKNEKVPS